MTARKQIWIWSAASFGVFFLLWILSDILLPFVAGLAVAYFLDPVADRLEAWRVPRLAATIIITVIFFILFAAGILLLVPMIANQVAALAEAWPEYVGRAKEIFAGFSEEYLGQWLPETNGLVDKSMDGMSGRLLNYGAGLLQGIASQGVALLNFLGLLFITPVVSFYMLNDWDRIIAQIDRLLPRDHADRIRVIAKEIDQVLSGFVRGMGTVCIVLSVFYATALQLAGLRFGLVVGLVAGLLSFIPFVGMAIGLVLSVVLAMFQFLPDRPEMVAIVLAIFVAGQALEGNFLTPRMVGRKIGLHPIWVIFGLLAFGALFGFVGMLLAVPVAAAIGVIIRHATHEYLESPLYWGSEPAAAAAAALKTPVLESPGEEMGAPLGATEEDNEKPNEPATEDETDRG